MCSSKQPAKLTMLLLLAVLLLCNGVGKVHGKWIHENSVDDLHALLDFKKGITHDPQGALSNWNTTSTHFCRWNGVNCTTTRPFRVLYLILSGQNLEGQISSSIGNLSFITCLDISMNNFVGSLPSLRHLQQLQILYLNNNNFTGTIPDSLSNCSSLAYLDLSVNSLSGVVPTKLGLLSDMEYINFKSNQLEGRIPNELGRLSKLQYLLLGNNRLSGEFPRSIFNLSASLQYLSLEFNMLGKTFPSNIGDLHLLKELTMENNRFEGQIPVSLGNALGLQLIDLSNNSFTGKIPTDFGKLSNLTSLNLQYNHLQARDSQDWEFLNSLRNCSSLNVLSLAYNELQGLLPESVGSLSSSLEQLLLAGNNLSGQVPQSIGKLGGLTKLSLDHNNFTGTINRWIKNLKNVNILHLESNNFTGPIPSSIGNLSKLIDLSLNGNKFQGLIPDSLGNLRPLELDLGNNRLEGSIPPNFANFQSLIFLNLSHNNLQGAIPQISNLKQLTILDLSSNKLTGEIPDSLGECYSLENLQMGPNFLTGNIPATFGNLSLLSTLNLSHNKFSGTIPLPLNRLEALNELDLSYNHLQGELPRNGVIGNATAVSLEGNWGLCGGAMDLHMPPCHAVSRRSEKYYLVRALIPLFAFMSLVMLTYAIITGKKTSRRTNLFLLSFGKKFPRVSYKDLDQTTGSFSEAKLLGRGSYGSVYRGKLTQANIQVAIKVFDLDMKCADKSFLTECDVLRSIRHRNLLPILTACSTIDNNGDDFRALIFEFMPNGNLDTWLHEKFAGGSCLSLAQRATIAVGIADALAYLHHDCERQIVHCDLKPTNILLDDDMNACLGDFGIASLVGDSSSNTSIELKGTIGYIAPEYAQGGQASICVDVYSFGIVLLEMLIGKRPTDPMFENELSLVNFVERNYPDHILHIIDARLQRECERYIQANITMENAVYGCLLSHMQVSLSCTRLIPRERMNIREVTTKLHSIRMSYIRATNREQVLLD